MYLPRSSSLDPRSRHYLRSDRLRVPCPFRFVLLRKENRDQPYPYGIHTKGALIPHAGVTCHGIHLVGRLLRVCHGSRFQEEKPLPEWWSPSVIPPLSISRVHFTRAL